MTATAEQLGLERGSLARSRRALEQALARAEGEVERYEHGLRSAADRGCSAVDLECRLRLLEDAHRKKTAAVARLEELDQRLEEIAGEIEALQAPLREAELDRQARARLELTEVECRVLAYVGQLETALGELATLSTGRQRRSEALLAVATLARRLGSDRAIQLRPFRDMARKAAQAPASNGNGNGNGHGSPTANDDCPVAGSERTRRRVRRLEREAPELAERVKAGHMSAGTAEKLVTRPANVLLSSDRA